MSYKASWNIAGAFSMRGSASASATRSGTGTWTSSSNITSSSSSSTKQLPESNSKKALPEYNVPPETSSDYDEDTPRESAADHDTPREHDSKHKAPQQDKNHSGPTVDAPFDFGPSETFDIVECTDSDDETDDLPLIAIPQLKPKSTSPLLRGYPPSLQSHGISKATWASFLDTISAFLEATVSDQAIQHAMDVAAEVGKRPKKLATTLASRTASIGRGIGDSARRGNVVGVAAGLINGAVSLPLNLVLGTTTAVLGAPISAALAASKKQPTARQRATAYVAVANQEWLVRRGLFAGIVDTKGLGELLGMPASALPVVEESDEKGGTEEETQYGVLEEYCEELETWGESSTQIGPETLWLVLTQVTEEN